MSVTSANSIVVPVPMSVETDLAIDNDGFFYLTIDIYSDEEDSQEVKIPFSKLVEDLLIFYKTEYGVNGYQDLYAMAHELSRQSEKMREVAHEMEDSLTPDLFSGK